LRLTHRLFGIAVAVKGLDGIVELAGGAALLLVRPGAIAAWTEAVTRRELSQHPGDFVAEHLRQWGADFGHSAQLFVAAYLLLHGGAKLLLAGSLLMGKIWAYPVAIAFLAAFIAYAGFRLWLSWSWLLAGVTLLDAATMWLIAREWRATTGSPIRQRL
jgi:uncharacterized membrane protein